MHCQLSIPHHLLVGVFLLQKLRNIRAALSLSLSNVVGQKASDPSLLLKLLTGAPSLSTTAYSFSKPNLLPDFVFSHKVAGMLNAEAEVPVPVPHCFSYTIAKMQFVQVLSAELAGCSY